MRALLRDSHPSHESPGVDVSVDFTPDDGHELSFRPRSVDPATSHDIAQMTERVLERVTKEASSADAERRLATLYLLSPFSVVLQRGRQTPGTAEMWMEIESLFARMPDAGLGLLTVDLHDRHLFFSAEGNNAIRDLSAFDCTPWPQHRPRACPSCGANFPDDDVPKARDRGSSRSAAPPSRLEPHIWCPCCHAAFAHAPSARPRRGP